MHFGRRRHARGMEYYRGEFGSVLSGGDAPDWMRVEGSSIVDESRECEPLCTKIKGANREVSERKADL